MINTNKLEIDLEKLLQLPEEHGYAFALWKHPSSETRQLIIDLDKPKPLETSFRHADTGFVVNKFSNHHPVKPLNIKSDIRVDLASNEIVLDPRVSDKKIDAFFEALKVTQKKKEHKPLIQPANDYQKLVSEAIEMIHQGHFFKVVLSRFKEMELPEDFNVLSYFDLICDTYPLAFCSIFHLPNEGIWIGASPEILIDSNERMFKTVALAGTKRLEDGQSLSNISWTQKEIEEQAIVSRYIINCFKKLRLREFEEYGPKTSKAGNLAHLKTEFWVDLSEVAFDGLGDQMMELLHPTSAVCGMPLEKSRNYILDHEGFDRSYFAGFIGPVNDEGNTHLFVNLRCMNIRDRVARLFAGAGITEDSDPESEFLETEMKMDVLLQLLKS